MFLLNCPQYWNALTPKTKWSDFAKQQTQHSKDNPLRARAKFKPPKCIISKPWPIKMDFAMNSHIEKQWKFKPIDSIAKRDYIYVKHYFGPGRSLVSNLWTRCSRQLNPYIQYSLFKTIQSFCKQLINWFIRDLYHSIVVTFKELAQFRIDKIRPKRFLVAIMLRII